MRAFICFLTATVLVMFYPAGFAEESVIPDLKGAWIGEGTGLGLATVYGIVKQNK